MKRPYRFDFRKAPPDPLHRKLQWGASLLLVCVVVVLSVLLLVRLLH
jgi:ABC-type phosphate transport system permease subunit